MTDSRDNLVAAWEAAVARELKGSPEQALVTRLLEGVEVAALVHDGALAGELPGVAPFTRGATPLPRRWDVRQRVAGPSVAEVAEALADEVAGGANSVCVALDAAARAGVSPELGDAKALIGAGGAAVYSLPMLADAAPTVETARALRLAGGGAFLPAVALHAALLRGHGVAAADVAGTDLFVADPLGALAAEGRLPVALPRAFDQLAAVAAWAQSAWPGVRCLRVSTLAYHDAGATETQDLAAALATGVAYLRELAERGLPLAQVAGQLAFEVRLGADLYVALAKVRALRSLWSRLLVACGVAADEQPAPAVYAATCWRVLTERDAWVNLLRASSSAFAAACAGVDGLTVVPFDAALGEPDRFGRRLARNTQLVLLEEAHLAKVADPAGGAWALERLTDDLARAAWGEFQQLERRGGMAAVLLDGSWQRDVDEAHAARMIAVANRSEPIVGVSEYPLVAETPVETHKLADPQAVAETVDADWQRAKQQRNDTAIQAALARLPQDDAAWDAAAVEALIEAAAAGASVAEMGERLGFAPVGMHDHAGTRIPEAFEPRRLAEPYEALRDAADEYAELHQGARPGVFVVLLGPPAEHAARASFVDTFAEAGGLEVSGTSAGVQPEAGLDLDAAVAEFRASGTTLAVLCGSDKRYAELLPQLAQKLKDAGCTWLVLAGQAAENAETWQAAGLDQTIHQGCDTLAILRQWHDKLGL